MQQNEPRPLHSKDTVSSESEPIYEHTGVDLTLIRWMLSLTPTQRLQTLQEAIRSIARLRGDNP